MPSTSSASVSQADLQMARQFFEGAPQSHFVSRQTIPMIPPVELERTHTPNVRPEQLGPSWVTQESQSQSNFKMRDWAGEFRTSSPLVQAPPQMQASSQAQPQTCL